MMPNNLLNVLHFNLFHIGAALYSGKVAGFRTNRPGFKSRLIASWGKLLNLSKPLLPHLKMEIIRATS